MALTDESAISDSLPDLDAARRFWAALTGGKAATWQTLPDHPGSTERPQITHGPLDALQKRLTAANQGGAAVSMMVNAGDLQGRSAANVTRTRALFVDLDGTPPPTDPALEPHLIVTTSPGRHHLYWLCNDVPLSIWPVLQRALAAHFGGDEAVYDLPRAMRVPGFVHRKDPANPHLVSLTEPYSGPRYTQTEVFSAWPFLVTALQAHEAARHEAERRQQEAARQRRLRPAVTRGDPFDTRHAARVEGFLQAHHDAVATAQPGGRHSTLNRHARALAGYAAGGEIDLEDVRKTLKAAATAAGMPEKEAADLIDHHLERETAPLFFEDDAPNGRQAFPKLRPGRNPYRAKLSR